MSGGRAAPWGAGVPSVVGTGATGSKDDAGGRKRGVNGGNVEGGGWGRSGRLMQWGIP